MLYIDANVPVNTYKYIMDFKRMPIKKNICINKLMHI